MTVIRSATVQDIPGVYRVCLQTGDSGGDATGLYRNPDLLGHVYVGPYLVGQPAHAFVAADAQGIAGYTFAAADTRAFEAWAEAEWWPPLREQYPLTEGSSPDDEVTRLLHAPETAPDEVVAEYAAHLHIDLLPRIQGQGLGRGLIDRVLGSLEALGVRGAHLGVAEDNENATRFYRHLGFEELAMRPGVRYLGMRLA
ncbi:GNAT family N-acetyltransferase [Leifsonia bigeumensis]|uniref:GNAT family N-acetyltransferase n=1 Tax=Leifsonella bigeumensis TaxID=433643 RepID=A0ABP7F9G8_9MICO